MNKQIHFLVRLGAIAVLIMAFLIINSYTSAKEKHTQDTEPPQAATAESIPLNTEPAPEPTISEPMEETTPPTEAPTIATEPPTEPPTEPETEPAETEPPYTADELEMLALVIYQEAGSDACSDDTRLMVGTVVMNRIADPRFPDTMYEVLTAKLQYGELYWTGIVWPSRASHPTEAAAVERAYAIAERILLGERAFEEDVVFQAEFIQGEIVEYSDGMYFCR